MRANELAIIIAFYLSKFDKFGLKNLGFRSDSEAFEDIAKALNVKKNYIKFRRDEFDPVHPWRKGWQRAMDIRIINTINILQDLSEIELRGIVLSIIKDVKYRDSEEVNKIISLIHDEVSKKKIKNFILRGPTGKMAEEYFIQLFNSNDFQISGVLEDSRDLGVGYDFKINTVHEEYYVEVKGLAENSGGVLFTDKEWGMANVKGDNYLLVIISNLKGSPTLNVFRNPAKKLKAKRNIIKTIQVNYSVTKSEIDSAIAQ